LTAGGVCPICNRHYNSLTIHHVFRTHVYKHDKNKQRIKINLCRACHDEVEKEITRKENILLRQHPEIYRDTINQFIYKSKK
jgi:hypothetical protein